MPTQQGVRETNTRISNQLQPCVSDILPAGDVLRFHSSVRVVIHGGQATDNKDTRLEDLDGSRRNSIRMTSRDSGGATVHR